MSDILGFLCFAVPIVATSHGLCIWLGRKIERRKVSRELIGSLKPKADLSGLSKPRAMFLPRGI